MHLTAGDRSVDLARVNSVKCSSCNYFWISFSFSKYGWWFGGLLCGELRKLACSFERVLEP